MGHDHHHHEDISNIKVAFFLNLVFTIIEIIGGVFTQSLAILSDALHDLGDSLSLGLAWYFQKLSKKKRDGKYSYGYKRFSLLGAIINSTVLIVGSVFIIRESILRFSTPQDPNSLGMMGLAILGIIVNGAAVLRLRTGHSHNEKIVSLHLLEDVFGWVAVLIGAVIIYFTGWSFIDPILSLGIAVFILFNVYRGIKSSIRIILQGIPRDISMDSVENALLSNANILSVHDLHIWSLDGQDNVMTVHLVTSKELSQKERLAIKASVQKEMASLGITHCTLEFELEGEDCGLVNC